MKRVLVISTLRLNYEGITSVIYNYISNMNRENLQIDFIAYSDINFDLKKQFEGIGKVRIVPTRKGDFKKYVKGLKKVLSNKYDVVHIHGNSGTMAIEAVIARIYRVKKIIVHCHSTTCNYPILNKILTPIMKIVSTDFVACSNDAGKWLFKKNYMVFNNAIDLKKFEYNKVIREKYRKQLDLENNFVIGHIGHFREQKNHHFLIDIFKELHKICPEAKLLLVSDGPLFEDIKNKVNKFNLQNDVIFLGRRNDVDKLYQAMDCFVFPSKWEGLGMVLVEAQASGLPCCVSDVVPLEAKCTDIIYYKSLSDNAKEWAKFIINIKNKNNNRNISFGDKIRNCGFDIKYEAEKLNKLYENNV